MQLAASTLPPTATAEIPSTPTPNYPQYHTLADLYVFPSPTPVPTFPNYRATVETEVQLTRVARATEHALTPTLPLPTRPSITATPEPIPLGILPYSPEHRMNECDYNSGWRGILNGEYVEAWAGGCWHSPQIGALVVLTRTFEHAGGPWTFYQTPADDGEVRVTAAEGLQLTLTAVNGQQFIFDVATRQWVNP
jgi:hypothetical protein